MPSPPNPPEVERGDRPGLAARAGAAWRRATADVRVLRLAQVLGLALVVAGLVGVTLQLGDERAALSDAQRALLGVEGDGDVLGFVVAGRDLLYGEGESTPIYDEEGTIVGWEFDGVVDARGVNTDTILYASLIDDVVTLVAIPRDLFVGDGTNRINGTLAREGPEGLMRRVEAAVGLPVDDYAILDLAIFQELVDALGGVEVNVPTRMYYRDVAGGLTIDLQPGPQRLDGQEASEFVRYRQFLRGDIDRLDNVKRLAYAMLARVKELQFRTAFALPELLRTYVERVETSVSPALVGRIAPRLGDLEIRSATLPTLEVERDGALGLVADPVAVRRFLAETYGGTAPPVAEPPDVPLRIVDASGREGLGAWYRDRLVAFGVPADRITLTEGPLDPSGTRVLATADHWRDAGFYADLLGVGTQQVDRLAPLNGVRPGIELVLAGDAFAMTPMGRASVPAAAPSVPAAPGVPAAAGDAALVPLEP